MILWWHHWLYSVLVTLPLVILLSRTASVLAMVIPVLGDITYGNSPVLYHFHLWCGYSHFLWRCLWWSFYLALLLLGYGYTRLWSHYLWQFPYIVLLPRLIWVSPFFVTLPLVTLLSRIMSVLDQFLGSSALDVTILKMNEIHRDLLGERTIG